MKARLTRLNPTDKVGYNQVVGELLYLPKNDYKMTLLIGDTVFNTTIVTDVEMGTDRIVVKTSNHTYNLELLGE